MGDLFAPDEVAKRLGISPRKLASLTFRYHLPPRHTGANYSYCYNVYGWHLYKIDPDSGQPYWVWWYSERAVQFLRDKLTEKGGAK